MDVAALERLIAGALALMLRAQQQAGPMLDLCSPRMIGPKEREELRQAHGQIMLAFVHANSAAQQLAQAAGMLGEFLRPESRV